MLPADDVKGMRQIGTGDDTDWPSIIVDNWQAVDLPVSKESGDSAYSHLQSPGYRRTGHDVADSSVMQSADHAAFIVQAMSGYLHK
jgi:hypothetical protein